MCVALFWGPGATQADESAGTIQSFTVVSIENQVLSSEHLPMPDENCGKRFRARRDLGIEWVENELLILDRRRQKIHQLNETASFVWACLDDGMGTSEIIQEITDVCGISPENATKDVEGILQSFFDLDLFEAPNESASN